jgi:hypothetical protein
MASTSRLPIPTLQKDRIRIRSPSPSQAYQSGTRSSASSSTATSRTRQSTNTNNERRYSSSDTKENEPLVKKEMSGDTFASPARKANGRLPSEEYETSGGTIRGYRSGSMEVEDTSNQATIRPRRGVASSPGMAKRQLADPAYNGLPTLPTIGDDDDVVLSSGPSSPAGAARPPPPAPSARAGSDPNYGNVAGSGTRKRRSSSIKRKLSPGVTPQKAVDWEIPRKAFHSSIGELTAL